MEIHQLEYLVAVADEGSVTRAAERLAMAQPSVSQQLRKLEREVGQPLFDRLPRGVVLTEAGRRLVGHARTILAELRDARRHVDDARRAVGGALTVGAIPTIAPFALPGIVRAFVEACPEVALTLVEDVTDRLVDQLERGGLDLALVSALAEPRRILVERVADEPLLVLLPAAHRLAAAGSVARAELAGERFLVLHAMHCLSGQVAEVCESDALRPAIVSRGAQLATIAEMVAGGLGISVVPEMMRARDADPRRAYRPFAEAAPARELNLAWSPDRYRTNAAREFARVARAHLSAGPPPAAAAPSPSARGPGPASGRSPGAGSRRRGRAARP